VGWWPPGTKKRDVRLVQRVCRLWTIRPNCLRAGGWSMTAVKPHGRGLLAILERQTPSSPLIRRSREGGRRQNQGRSTPFSTPFRGRWMLVWLRWPMPGMQADLLQRLVWPCRNAAVGRRFQVAQGGE